jgi:N-succinyl-L-ornithine transcarbamylase
MVTAGKMAATADAKFMHCLPVRRNVVVEDAVLDGSSSVVIRQAGNRIWSAQAVLKRMLEAL